MEIFRVSRSLQFVCDSGSTRNGFKHEATLFKNGREEAFAKVNYLNRTWESFTYQSVMFEAIDKAKKEGSLTSEEIKKCEKAVKNNAFLKR